MGEYKKTDHYILKLIDGSRALAEFFGEVTVDYRADPLNIADRLSTEYKLTNSQSGFLSKLAERVSQSKEIVVHLMDKYGATPESSFKDPEGLYKAVYKKDAPSGIKAKPYSFAIGFYLPNESFTGNLIGQAHNDSDIDYMLTQNIQAVRGGSSQFTRLYSIAFRLNHDALTMRGGTLSGRLLDKMETSSTERHEMRHVMDNFLPYSYLSETAAYLYDNTQPSQPILKEDIGWAEELLRFNREFENLMETDEDTRKEIKSAGDTVRILESFSARLIGLINSMQDKGLSGDAISFLLSTIQVNKIEQRLESINDYLSRNPIVED